MSARAYYNDNDPAAAFALRAMISDGLIPPGEVDDRSIKDVQPDDLRGFVQHHFFAGCGGWPYAARLAGWPDERSIWSASCPCQPFSGTGKGRGVDDARHLWPDLFRLWSAFRPACAVGEQVAGAAGYGWFDGVRADLAREGYASEGVDIPALAVDAPHQRQRLYWIAVDDAEGAGRETRNSERGRNGAGEPGSFIDHSCGVEHAAGIGRGEGQPEYEFRRGRDAAAGADASIDVADADSRGRARRPEDAQRRSIGRDAAERADGVALVDATRERWREGRPEHEIRRGRDAASGADARGVDLVDADRERLEELRGAISIRAQQPSAERPNGSFYADAEWIICADGKARRTKPGLRLLVDGLPGRIHLWRLAGNGIVLDLAAQVIGALKDAIDAGEIASPALSTHSHRRDAA